ncbi:MAG TPA: hypothetical protein PKO06_04480 [Candidatus Ozemobacteraceae bacterium]|nr:hypothetical protein [Candidatus Ozemobacteraceae bacterium]
MSRYSTFINRRTAVSPRGVSQPGLLYPLFLLFVLGSVVAAASQTDERLSVAFQRAFADGEQFRQTELFACLGYTASQSRAMAEITPRPAGLIVTAVPAIASGTYEQINVVASAVRYYGLTIAEASFTFPLVRLDEHALSEGRLVLREVPEVLIETRVSAADLLRVFPFSNRSRQLSNLRLSIAEKHIDLRGNVRRGMFLVAFHIRGKPVLDGAKKVDFSCSRLVLNGIAMPRAAIRAMFSHVNPVFDATKTWLNLELLSIHTEPGTVCTRVKLCQAQPATERSNDVVNASDTTVGRNANSGLASHAQRLTPSSERNH